MRPLRSALQLSLSAAISLGAFSSMALLFGLRPHLPELTIRDLHSGDDAVVYLADVEDVLQQHYLAANPPPPPPPPAPEPEPEPAPEPEPVLEPEPVAEVVAEPPLAVETTEAVATARVRPPRLRHPGVDGADQVITGAVSRPPRKKRACEEGTTSIAEVGENQYTIERDLVDYYAGDIEEAMTLAYVSWFREEGKIVGFQVRRIHCGSVLHQAGFRNGDVIRSINGRPVTTIPQALLAYRKLRKKRHLEVDVIRKTGEAVLLTYRLT